MKIEAKTDREILVGLSTEVSHIRKTLDEHNAQTAEIADKAEKNKQNHIELQSQIKGGITAIKWIGGLTGFALVIIQIIKHFQ